MFFLSYPPAETKIALAKAIVREFPKLGTKFDDSSEGHVSFFLLF